VPWYICKQEQHRNNIGVLRGREREEDQVRLSKHARARAQQRGIPESNLPLVLSLGTEIGAENGASRYVLTNKDCDERIATLKREISVLEKSRGKAVVAKNGILLTAYHSRTR
jgi:hypothetical protein